MYTRTSKLHTTGLLVKRLGHQVVTMTLGCAATNGWLSVGG